MKKRTSRAVRTVVVILMMAGGVLSAWAQETGAIAAGSNQSAQALGLRRTIEQIEGKKSAADVNVWRSLGAFIFVLGGLFAANRWLRKRSLGVVGRTGQRRRLRMIERFAIDQKRSLMLVAVDDRELLLGIGSDHITNLMELPGEEDAFDELMEPRLETESKPVVSRIFSMVGQNR
ncbi:MAG: hypothetical protein EOM20_10900 [Spartobacteria bacterium]|nr:hypothetical protein [Spartobacteria bacterium]